MVDANILNEELKNIRNSIEFKLLIRKSNEFQLMSVLHRKEIDSLTIENGIAKYTYKNSNIKGRCKVEHLHLYIKFV